MAVDLITEKGLPHSLDAERSVLGAIILENESIYQILDVFARRFLRRKSPSLFERFTELITVQRAVDLVTLARRADAHR